MAGFHSKCQREAFLVFSFLQLALKFSGEKKNQEQLVASTLSSFPTLSLELPFNCCLPECLPPASGIAKQSTAPSACLPSRPHFSHFHFFADYSHIALLLFYIFLKVIPLILLYYSFFSYLMPHLRFLSYFCTNHYHFCTF